MFLVFLNYFDVLMSKIILKKLKNIILIHFDTKNIIIDTRYFHLTTPFKTILAK